MFELDDEYTESDIPTTLIRSKADCPNMEVCVCGVLCVCVCACVCSFFSLPQSQTTLTTNDIVINKLTQILSYLRQGARATGKKGKKRDKAPGEGHVSVM